MAGSNREMLEFLFVGPLFSIFKQLKRIERNQKDMATQAEVNALVEELGNVSSRLTKGFGEVTNEIEALKLAAASSQPPLDLSGLQAKIEGLAGQAQALDNLVPDAVSEPEPPAEEPEPETPSEPTEEAAPEPADPNL